MKSEEPKTLFLVLCSNEKNKKLKPYQSGIDSMAGWFPTKHDVLLERRRRVFDLVSSNETGRAGQPLGTHSSNKQLHLGPDVSSGELAGESARYLEAKNLYDGRFYQNADVHSWGNRRHHVLIVSAFYGLVVPEEQIQLYSCHLGDHDELSKIWTTDELITELVEEYVEVHKIVRIFDLLGVESYRQLFDWNRLSEKCRVRHLFSADNAGADALPALGRWLKHQLQAVDETETESLAISEDVFPPLGWPNETDLRKEQWSQFDEAYRAEIENALRCCLGAKRWKLLEESGSAASYVVDAVTWLNLKTTDEYSCVVVLISKALECVIHDKIILRLGELIREDNPNTWNWNNRIQYRSELREQDKRIFEYLLNNDDKPNPPTMKQMGWLLGNRYEVPKWLLENSESGRRFLEALDLERIPKSIRDAAELRNGMAHRSAADRSTAQSVMNSSFGEFTEDWKTLQAPGVLICLLDKLIAYREPTGKEK